MDETDIFRPLGRNFFLNLLKTSTIRTLKIGKLHNFRSAAAIAAFVSLFSR